MTDLDSAILWITGLAIVFSLVVSIWSLRDTAKQRQKHERTR